MNNIKPLSGASIVFVYTTTFTIFSMLSCMEHWQGPVENNIQMQPLLSDYAIYQGDLSGLVPSDGYQLYELSTELFTDYARKQRLVKIPPGTQIIENGDGLPDFPDSTILVKTFYYYYDERDTSRGKKVLETRLLIKSNGQWNAGTYIWNEKQNEANLVDSGLDQIVNWIDSEGQGRVVSYHIPNVNECGQCHSTHSTMVPLGPKLRNLNRDVHRDGKIVNQLQYMAESGLIDHVDPSAITALPDWENQVHTLEERARAYLDINCAHCHIESGTAANMDLWLDYDVPLHNTRLIQKKGNVASRMQNGQMPKIGTTIVHEEAVALIKEFLDSKTN